MAHHAARTWPRGLSRPSPPPTNRKRFLVKQHNTKGTVVDRKDFVGRRRPLQRFVRALRGSDRPAGVVVHGLGGVGKSSLACRLCDRLDDFDPVVHVGMLDEPTLLRTLESLDSTSEQRALLQGSPDALRHRLRAFLGLRRETGRKRLLLVLDDFEQNTPLDERQQPLISTDAQQVLEGVADSPRRRASTTAATSRPVVRDTGAAAAWADILQVAADQRRCTIPARGTELYSSGWRSGDV
jgi:hypothetical protein